MTRRNQRASDSRLEQPAQEPFSTSTFVFSPERTSPNTHQKYSQGSISRRRFTRAIGLGATALGLAYVTSKIPLATAELPKPPVTEVPPAIIEPNIDGIYTPRDDLHLTPLGKELVEKDSNWMPKDEWFDCEERKYNLLQIYNPASQSEWYARVKKTDKKLYMLTDVPTDLEVGKISGNKDTRQILWLTFDRKNTGDVSPSAPGYYTIAFYFQSQDKLVAGPMPGSAVKQPVLPPSSYKYKWSISESPHSSTPHIMIESEFDLELLTKYSKQIRCEFYAFDIDGNLLTLHRIFDFSDGVPIPDLISPQAVLGGTVAAAVGMHAIYKKRANKGMSRREFLGPVGRLLYPL